MNDLDTIRDMFKRAGVVWEEAPAWDPNPPRVHPDEREWHLHPQVHAPAPPPGTAVLVTEGEGPNNHGYAGFGAVLSFREDGSLQWVGAWE